MMETTTPPAGTASAAIVGRSPIVFGRELIGELPLSAHRPYLVVTMADLWPRFEHHFDSRLAAVHLVTTIETAELEAQVAALPEFGSVIGLGGGQAIDVAKFMAWTPGPAAFHPFRL